MGRQQEQREISGATTKLILDYVETVAGSAALARTLELAGLSDRREELRDEHSWWSQETKTALFRAAAETTGDAAVARRVGEHVIRPVLGEPFKYPITEEGSARSVFANIAAAAPRFSTIANIVARDVGDGWAQLEFWLDDVGRATRFDCDYVQGLASTVPRLFNRVYGRVQHERCQLDGWGSCTITVDWADAEVADRSQSFELDAARGQLRSLQDLVADLVSIDDIQGLLSRIAQRASIAMRAQRYLLAVHLADGGPLHVRADGIHEQTAQQLGAALLDPTRDDDPDAIVVDVASARHHFGRLAAYFPPGRSFYAAEREMLRAYARVAAAALDSATALDAARAQRRAAETLLRVSTRLADCVLADDIALAAAESVVDMVGVRAACVLLWDAESDVVSVAARIGDWRDAQFADPAIAEAWIARRGWSDLTGVAVVDANRPVASPLGALRAALSASRLAVVPIAHGATLRACALGVWAAGDAAPVDAMARLRGLADQSSVAMARAALLREVHRRASHDDLTGLPRRPLLEDRLEQALARRRRTAEQIAVLFVDLDEFKDVNDVHGHAAGDDVLRAVGERMTAQLRETDTVARIGGDEFAVLIPDVGGELRAAEVARQLTRVIAEPVVLASGRVVSVGGSVGIAYVEDGDADGAGLLARADEAMYAAKRDGGGWKLHGAVR